MSENNIIIRAANLRDAKKAARTHSVSASLAYRQIFSQKLLEEHFSESALAEFWIKQIQNSIDHPDRFNVMVAENLANYDIAGVNLTTICDTAGIALLSDFDLPDKIGNINTLYLHPDYQRHGLGHRFMHKIAGGEMFQNIDYYITETLEGYSASPEFYKKFGAVYIADNPTSISGHYETEDNGHDDCVVEKFWLMKKSEIINRCEKGNKMFGENIIIRNAELKDARSAAHAHSVSATLAYSGIHSDKLLKDHFNEQVLSEFWMKQIRNSINCPNLFQVIVAEDLARGGMVGVCLSTAATDKGDGHILPMLADAGVDIKNFCDTIVGNINTMYFLPEYQRKGIGHGFMHKIATSGMFQKADLFITETLDKYAASPEFYKKFGAVNIGQYETAHSKHYGEDIKDKDDGIVLRVWLMKKSDIIKGCSR
jgi:GNAT superfamily N-acetyltransferase